jgi:hypothetical protein
MEDPGRFGLIAQTVIALTVDRVALPEWSF